MLCKALGGHFIVFARGVVSYTPTLCARSQICGPFTCGANNPCAPVPSLCGQQQYMAILIQIQCIFGRSSDCKKSIIMSNAWSFAIFFCRRRSSACRWAVIRNRQHFRERSSSEHWCIAPATRAHSHAFLPLHAHRLKSSALAHLSKVDVTEAQESGVDLGDLRGHGADGISQSCALNWSLKT